MAREVIVRTWCDPCMVEDKRTEGEELPPLSLIPGRKPRVVALCGVHRKELYDPLLELLTEHGQSVDEQGNPTGNVKGRHKPRESAIGTGEFACPAEGCDHEAPNKAALQAHCRNMHDAGLAELLGEPVPFVCPVKGCGKKFNRNQGLTLHVTRTHPDYKAPTSAKAAVG